MDTQYSTCVNCGQAIKNIVVIGGKNYGTTCAEYILNRSLPQGFKGNYSDLVLREKKAEAKQADLRKEAKKKADFERELTMEYWPLLKSFSLAMSKARAKANDWETNFIYSVAKQIFGGSQNFEGCHKYETMEEAKQAWDSSYMGTFPSINYRSRNMSEAQERILNRILHS